MTHRPTRDEALRILENAKDPLERAKSFDVVKGVEANTLGLLRNLYEECGEGDNWHDQSRVESALFDLIGLRVQQMNATFASKNKI